MRVALTARKTFIRLLTIALTVSVFTLYSCTEDELEGGRNKEHNISLDFMTRAGETAAEQIPSMRLFTFHHGGGNDRKFHKEVLNLARTSSKVTAQVETGEWNMALVSTPNGGTLISPASGTPMATLPMYRYEPTMSATGSSSAHEMYLDNRLTPDITSGGSHQMSAQLNRTVAKVELIIRKTTPNFNLSGTHKIRLHHVPSTISYTGALLPNKTTPDTLATALEAPVTLQNAGGGSYEGTQTVTFLIPAHRGTDAFSSATPADTTTLKMNLSVDLERTGGTRFTKQAQIPFVARANTILRVYVTVNDGLEFSTSVLPWEEVKVDATVGSGYQNWLYVKKDATGNGLSWSDPLPNITTAIDKANALKAAGKPVHGVLVAGGSNLPYNSTGHAVYSGLKIYGGWKGEPGTELAANDATAPYTSADRDLKNYKAYVNVANGGVVVAGDDNYSLSVLDGFVLSGIASTSHSGLLTVGSFGWVNAIEIDRQTSIASDYVLSVVQGTATNILVSRNNKNVYIDATGKVVNATIVENTGRAMCYGTLLNSVYWGNTGLIAAFNGSTVKHCAIDLGGPPAGTSTIYPLEDTKKNDAWFTASNVTPGPHFNLDGNPAEPRYVAGTAKPNRAPMLRRGNKAAFDDNLPITLVDQYKKDINGNIRHDNITDIGCYESAQKGFEFRWNMTDIYISPKVLIESDHLALLFDNSENAYVQWEATDFVITSNRYSVIAGTTSGSGNTVNLGSFKLKSSSIQNTGTTDLNCGSLTFKCLNIDKSYFPDVQMTVYQSPATSVVWTAGYAGSFHRWNETGPRYVFGENSGAWTARIISGHDWIKIDGEARPVDPYNDIEVEETFGGVVTGNGNIVFRVGMKSILTSANAQPRYGLISITRMGIAPDGQTKPGVALFFVRQGEAADYLYGPDDARALGPRTGAIKFLPYNLTDPSSRFSTSGVNLGKNGGGFVDYPSKTGYFFKWNSYVAYYPDNSMTGTSMGTTYKSGAWDAANEPCPNGYFTPTNEQFVHSYFFNRSPGETGAGSAAGTTFVWGRLADGYFDKIAVQGVRIVGTGVNRATEGLLMYNDYTNASVFFPEAGYRRSTGMYNDYIQWTQTSSVRAANTMYHTHSYGTTTRVNNVYVPTGHLGMSCTTRMRSDGLSVRCVKE